MDNSTIQLIAVAIIPVVFAITVHEVAHGWMANRLGDATAQMMGRLTLNPIKHIDPIGTILVPGILLVIGGFLFGWAKPVPVTWENLKHPRRDIVLVAIAGPASNFLMALFWVLILKLTFIMGSDNIFTYPLFRMAELGVMINLILMLLNLLPILPLDGGRVTAALLPPKIAWQYGRLENWGLIIILILIPTGILGSILLPPLNLITSLLYRLMGL